MALPVMEDFRRVRSGLAYITVTISGFQLLFWSRDRTPDKHELIYLCQALYHEDVISIGEGLWVH